MNLGVILPHTQLYGGVKRFLELGNIFIKNGHSFTVFTPDAKDPSWFKFNGTMETIENINSRQMDAVFLTELSYAELLAGCNARHKVFYHVRENEPLKKILMYPQIEVFACSSNIYHHDQKKFRFTPFKAIGGIDTTRYQAKAITDTQPDTVTIMMYGRLCEKKKGTLIAVKACEDIYKRNKNIRLLLFDAPLHESAKRKIDDFTTTVPHDFVLNHPLDKNVELFHRADIFVALEKRAGWANTVAEAMACGIPVVATDSGALDFLQHDKTGVLIKRNRRAARKGIESLIADPMKRKRLGLAGRNKIEEFDWNKLAEKIIAHLRSSTPSL